MTIKQQGGVFGRNPTFNDVTSASATTNDLTVNANGTGITISGNNTSAGSKNNLRFVDTDASVASGQQVGRIEFYTSDAGNEGINAYIEGRDSSSSGSGSIVLGTGNSGAAVDRLELVSGGNLNLLTGNLVIGTSGKGIDFSATAGTGTSELFDDYEEGTWTPVAADASTGGNLATPGAVGGYYRKIGDMVFLHGYLGNIGVSGMTAGNVFYIRGLPFPPASPFGVVSFYSGSIWCQTITFTDTIAPILISSATWITLESVKSALNDSSVLVSDLNAGGTSDLSFTIAYPTA